MSRPSARVVPALAALAGFLTASACSGARERSPADRALTGMFTYMADAPAITLCEDGGRVPVAMEADYKSLEAAYRQARRQPGEAVLVSVEGMIAARPSAEPGQPPRPHLVVERFIGAWPRETCGNRLAESPLRNTYWKLVRLGDGPVQVADRQREPHLIFNASEARLSGHGGCGKDASYLVTKNTYKDFMIRVEFWASDDANSGVYMRCQDATKITDETCYEANIFDQRPDPTYGTGALVKVVKVVPMPKAGGKWNTYEITAQGTHLVLVLNGVKTVDVQDSKLSSGPIALQWARGTIKFRKVEIKPL
jgi:3-keto-disaccharide hydrolase/NlpE-like protein